MTEIDTKAISTEDQWMRAAIDSMEVGVIIVDAQGRVKAWNAFMENHSRISAATAKGQRIQDLFPTMSSSWLEQKIETISSIRTPLYSSWENRPFVIPLQSPRPVTGSHDLMRQNVSLSPIADANDGTSLFSIVIYDVTEIAVHRHYLEQANRQLDEISKTDRLTGVLNRGAWETQLETEITRAQRYKGPLSVLIADIDHFKQINDTYGHQVGDTVLKQITRSMASNLRDPDTVGRIGGEEFAAVLPETGIDGAVQLAERLRDGIEKLCIDTSEASLQCTMSIGVAELRHADQHKDQLVKRADDALYRAKRGGRNLIEPEQLKR